MEKNFQNLINLYQKINLEEKEKLIKYLEKSLMTRGDIKKNKIIKNRVINSCTCPNCSCNSVKKNGHHVDSKGNKIQKYKCCECNKIFRDTTDTVADGCHKKEYWEEFLRYSLEGLSLRKIADKIGDVTYITIFNWKKKIIKHLEEIDVENLLIHIKNKE